MQSQSKTLLSKISGLLSDQKHLVHYSLVKKIIQNAQSRVVTPGDASFCHPRTGERTQLFKGQLRTVVVFVAGGGSFYEYDCMHRLEQELPGVQVVYGSDHVFSPEEFLSELNKAK